MLTFENNIHSHGTDGIGKKETNGYINVNVNRFFL